MNNVKVFGLMAGLTALLGMLGMAFGGSSGMITMLLVAGAMNFFMYYSSAKMVLRMYRAQVVTAAEAPELYEMVDRLRQRAGLPMPTVAIAPHEQPNAFATGRNPENAVVCVTAGIMRLVSREELEGVIAHELAHIKNRDMLLQTIAATMAAAITNFAFIAMFMGGNDEDGGNPIAGLLTILLAPIAATLIQMAISRQREFKADAVGAEICGRPLALAGALTKLDAAARRIPMHVAPAAAPLAQVNPLSASGGGMRKLFSTHPPTEERVARLAAMRIAA
jgi:heat shock protein HtpX